MNHARELHELGQSVWLDNVSRGLLDSGTLARYLDEFAVTGLTSNPTIFDEAIKDGDDYDEAIREKSSNGLSGEELFVELAMEDLRRAADLFKPVFEKTDGVDGWVSLELSPKLVHDTAGSVKSAVALHANAMRPNFFIKIPGNRAGVPAIEDAIFAGVPINVTLLFSCEQYIAAAEAYVRGIERRIEAGRDPRVASVASLFVSRWDVAVKDKVPAELRNRLGIAVAMPTYKAYRDLLESPRYVKIVAAGARPQRLLWASTGTKDPDASEMLYVEALIAPDTIDTMPEKTLKAFAERGNAKGEMRRDGGDAERVMERFKRAGIEEDTVADQLQRDGAKKFEKSWNDLLDRIASKSTTPARKRA